MKIWLFSVLIVLMVVVSPAQNLLLKNTTLYTFDRGVLEGYDLLVRNGRIEKIGKNIINKSSIPEIDLSGKSVVPGLIDSHTHIALSGGGNEFAENITPEMKVEYEINPDQFRGSAAPVVATGSVNDLNTPAFIER